MTEQQQRQADTFLGPQGLSGDDEELDASNISCSMTNNGVCHTLFDSLNYDRHGKYPPMGAATCFFSTTNCGGDVYNGTCENHWGLHHVRFQPVSSPISQNALIFPVATKTHSRPVRLVPLLSMLGVDGEKVVLVHDDSTIQQECEFMFNMGMKSTTEYSTQIAPKLHAFKQQYNGYIQSKISEIAQRTVSVTFTPAYEKKKKSAFAEKLYQKAKERARSTETNLQTDSVCILVPLKMFQNIYDILTIMAYWPGQYTLSDQPDDVVSVVPNVYIVDGWFVGGLGFGVPAFTGTIPTKKLGNFETHTIDNRTKEKLMRNVTPVINPLVLDYRAPPPGSLYVIRPSVTSVSSLYIDRDIMPESYVSSSNSICGGNEYAW